MFGSNSSIFQVAVEPKASHTKLLEPLASLGSLPIFLQIDSQNRILAAIIVSGTVFIISVLITLLKASTSIYKEPPLAPFRTPLINHTFTFLRLGPSTFLRKIREHSIKAKPYTVIVGGQSIYSFNHPDDLKMIHRNPRAFTWLPFVLKHSKKFIGHETEDEKLCFGGLNDPNSWFSKFVAKHHLMSVQTNGYLSEVIERAAPLFGDEFNDLVNISSAEVTKVDLDHWLKHVFFRVTTGMYFGPRNIFTEAENPYNILQSYTIWEKNIGKLVMGICNKFFNRTVLKHREELVTAHKAFLSDPERLQHAMSFIRDRRTSCIKGGYSLDGNSRSDMGLLFGSVSNARSAAFWCIYHAFANKQLHANILSELKSAKAIMIEADIGIVSMRAASECKHAYALFNEVLRYYEDMFHIRMVTEDTTVKLSDGNTYSLKKDGVVLVNAHNLFFDFSIWGEDADVFNPYRFLKNDLTRNEKKLQNGAFKPFGGGSTLCPGQKMAWIEGASLIAALAGFFDVEVPAVAPKMRPRDGMGVMSAIDKCEIKVKARGEVKRIVFRC